MRAWVAGSEGRIEIDRPWYQAASFTLTRRTAARSGFESPDGVVVDTPSAGPRAAVEAARWAAVLRLGL